MDPLDRFLLALAEAIEEFVYRRQPHRRPHRLRRVTGTLMQVETGGEIPC